MAVLSKLSVVVFATLAVLALFVQSTSAYYQGACVKQPITDKPVGLRYHIRIPHGQQHAQDADEDPSVPGQHYYDYLRSCRPHQWSAIYDREGNAHLSFVIRDKKVGALPAKGINNNRCDVASRIYEATNGKYQPECPYGDGALLADTWQKSWKDE